MRFRIPVICVLGFCLAASAAGQGPVRDFRLELENNPLLGFSNAACLASLRDDGFSEAAAAFNKENGGVVPLSESPDAWSVDVGTRAFRRVNDKIVFSGKLSYSYFRGARMGGPILMNPEESAINFLEEDESTVGTKKRESYSLQGGLSYSLSERWSLGVKTEYKAEDQTKYKDPRFLNVVADLSVSPGVMFRPSGRFSIGGNLIYCHRLEQLSAGTFGTIERQFDILVDQGGFLGTKEVFDGDMGYVSDQNTRPMTDDRYGLSLQTVFGNKTRLYVQLTGLWRSGFYGSRTSTSVVFCEFRGPEVKAETILLVPAGENQHRVALDAGFRPLSKLTNSYSYKAEAGKTTTIEYHGQNETLSRSDLDARLDYSFRKGVSGYRPDWIFGASADFFMRKENTSIYPDYRDRHFLNVDLGLSAERNFKSASNCFTIGGSLSYLQGWGDPKQDGSYSQGNSKLKSFDDWLYRQFEYDTASRAGGGISLAWTSLRPKRVAPYLKLSDRFVSLLAEPQHLQGRFRNEATLTLGCNF